jgi:hypothetical protein
MLKPKDYSENNGHTSQRILSPWTKPPTSGSSGAPTCIAARRSDAMSAIFVSYLVAIMFALIVIVILENNDDGGAA